jgi:DNA-binding NarL/FixJ family response regulator
MVILGVASARDMVATLDELRTVLPMMPPIVLVAPRGLPATLDLALELADAFVLRTAAVDELSCAVEEVRQGRSYLSPSVNSTLDQYVGAQRSSTLTERELTVVKLIALGHHNREIAHDLGLSVRTVESHRAHALYKLQLTSRTQLVHWALREHVI